MKKLLLLACACLIASTSAFAQIIQSESRTTQTFYEKPKVSLYPYYQGEVNIGYETPATGFLETIHGVRLNKYLFVGAGIGIHYIGELELEYKDIYMIENVSGEGRFPLFVNLKGYLPLEEKMLPYLNFSMGYDIGVDYGGGFYCDLGLGLKYRNLNLGLGWMHHGFTDEQYYHGYYEDISVGYNAFYLKIGLCW